MSREIEQTNNSSGGFTLAETLLAVLILLMVSTIVANGIPAAKSAYENVVLAANAEVFMSTSISTLRNEIATAKDIKVDGTTVSYFNPTRGTYSRIVLDSSSGIQLQRYYNYFTPRPIPSGTPEPSPAPSVTPTLEPLVFSSSTEKFYLTCSAIVFENGVIKFRELQVNQISGRTGLVKRDEVSIRVIS